ncbi:MAG TPA: hypothetical protein EYP57_08760 [Thermodesulfobacteriaceae bacterium]|nr:hypothetical protein [Thermodesulfobacteriaceae bacterium]
MKKLVLTVAGGVAGIALMLGTAVTVPAGEHGTHGMHSKKYHEMHEMATNSTGAVKGKCPRTMEDKAKHEMKQKEHKMHEMKEK